MDIINKIQKSYNKKFKTLDKRVSAVVQDIKADISSMNLNEIKSLSSTILDIETQKLREELDKLLLQKEQLGADTGAHEYITKELIKIEAKSSLRTAVEYASTDEDYTDCAVALQDFDSELDMGFMLDVLDEINSRSSSKSLNSYIEQIRTALRIVEMASNNEQLAS